MSIEIERLDAAGAAAAVDALAEVLIDCVDGGASVSFMQPLTRDAAAAFWRGVADAVARGDKAVVVARDGARIVGTAQLVLGQPPNQPHRADVAKVLVHRDARRRGIAAQLMVAIEAAARAERKSVLVLDTVTGGDAERLYARLGWERVGVIPDYALFPDGRYCATTYFYKRVG